jgi:hypothetical protein
VRIDSLTSRQSRIVDASERGMALILPHPRAVGTRIHITVQVGNPPTEISVAGIIVHITALEGVSGGSPVRAGIFLTEAGPDWTDLCNRLAAAKG